MVKKGRKAPLVERMKSILIVLLSLSAIYLALRVQLPGVLNGLISKPETIGGGAQTTVEERTAIAHPLHMAVMVQGGSESQRYGVQYDQADGNALFQQLYGLLVEALSSTSQPVQVEEELWKNALSTAPGVYFDWQGVLPFSVLNGWLSVDNSRLTGSVRHLVLTTAGEQVTLYYRNEADGLYYTCTSDVVSSSRLREAVGAMKGNEAVFAFEDETYQKLSPYTMLLKHPPSPAIYTVSNPLMEREGFEKLLDELGFPKDSSYYYNALGEQVIRHENDTLRISDSGVVTYDADEDRQRFPVPEDLYGMVESCRQLAQETLGSLGGEAQLYLMSANELDQGVFQVEFGLSLIHI